MDIPENATHRYISDTFPQYHHDILLNLHQEYSLSGKRILDVGGSNIPSEFMRDLEVKQFICLDPITKWVGFHSNAALPTTKYGKKIYSKDAIVSSLPDEFCFIVDVDIEDAGALFDDYFDIIVSISTFEHVTNIRECLQTIYKFLHSGGILHSQYEPVFSSPMGHHCYLDKDINFVNLRELDNIHLLYTKGVAREFIHETFDWPDDIKETVLRQIYDSPIINRKTINDHVLEIMNSPFNKYSFEYFSCAPSSPFIQARLNEKLGFMRFDVRGIKLRCIKD